LHAHWMDRLAVDECHLHMLPQWCVECSALDVVWQHHMWSVHNQQTICQEWSPTEADKDEVFSQSPFPFAISAGNMSHIWQAIHPMSVQCHYLIHITNIMKGLASCLFLGEHGVFVVWKCSNSSSIIILHRCLMSQESSKAYHWRWPYLSYSSTTI